jgi:hypothetical protein
LAGDNDKTPASWRSGERQAGPLEGCARIPRWIEIPEKIGGYATQGSRISLDLAFGSDANANITIFSNGSILFRGDENTQQPMLLTDNAQPGQKYLVAARVDAGDVDTAFSHSDLNIEPPASRPDPRLMREEILSARSLDRRIGRGQRPACAATGRRSQND